MLTATSLPGRPCVRSATIVALAAVLAILPAAAPELCAQESAKVLTIDDYSRWSSISGNVLSGDGRWVAYEVRRTNVPTAEARPTLHLYNAQTGVTEQLPDASGATFSEDSRWFAYSIEPPTGRGGRAGSGAGAGAGGAPAGGSPSGTEPQGRGSSQPPSATRRTALRRLSDSSIRHWEDVQSFTFSPSSGHLLLRRRAATGAPAGRGVDVVVHDLRSGRDLPIGSVIEASFNEDGSLLAYAVEGAVRDGNGVFILELATSRIVPLDNDARHYSRLTWSQDGNTLAVLKGLPVQRMRERSNVLLVIRDVAAALKGPLVESVVLDPAATAGFPADWVLSERATLTFSDSGSLLFIGTKPQLPAPDSARRGTDSIPDVDIWHTGDDRIQSVQMIRAEADRNFTYRQAFDYAAGRYIGLTDSTMREITISRDGRWGIGLDPRPYISDHERPRADVYRVNTATGERTLLVKEQFTAHNAGISPNGRYFLYWRDSHYHAWDLDANSSRNITRGVPVSFINTEYDNPGVRPAYGVVSHSRDGSSVILSHRYDLWVVPLTAGSAARNLTGGIGAKNEVRFSWVRTETGRAARNEGMDLTQPLLFAAFGQWTKKAGFHELRDGTMRELVFDDAAYSTPVRGTDADVFLFTRQTYTEFPDLHLASGAFSDARRISNVNPHHSEYKWGRRILFEYKNRSGVRLQGTLAIPDDYVPGERRPMLVNFYEKNSQNLHRYPAPSYLTGMGSVPVEALSQGYLIMQPDIHFRTGSSHTDMLECVEAAVRKVIEMGYADPARIGLNGHSYGGEGAAYIATRSKLFAAVGMGAGVTDLTSDFNHNWGWSYQVSGGSGANGHNYYIYGQGRWGTNPWDSPELFRNESARTHVRSVTAPILIMHGTADPTVSFQEGLGFYNALRFNGKQAVLLAYPGEGHGLRGMANRRDLTIRYMQFFNHYLKGEAAPKWLSEGIPFLARDANRDPG